MYRRFHNSWWAAFLIAVCFWASSAAYASSLNVPLTVEESAGVNRLDCPITSGVPLPQGVAKETSDLLLVDDSAKTQVPCQFTVLGTWPDGSIKWVLLDFFANVTAGTKATYTLCGSLPGGVTKLADPAAKGKVTVKDEPNDVKIDTGPLSVTVSKARGTLLDRVVLNRKEIFAVSKPTRAVLKLENNALAYTNLGKPTAVAVEDAGPLRACVRVEGAFYTAPGQAVRGGNTAYTARITTYAGKPYVKIAFTFRHAGSYNKSKGWFRFKSLALDLPFSVNSGVSVSKFSCSAGEFDVSSTKPVSLIQWFRYPTYNKFGWTIAKSKIEEDREKVAGLERTSHGFYYLVTQARKFPAKGERAEGWATVSSRGKPVMSAMVRRFWQNFPRGIAADHNSMSVLLWPEGSFWPRIEWLAERSCYQVEGSRQKTAEVLLWFGEPPAGSSKGSASFEHPLIARAPFAWYRDTGAVWPLASVGIPAKDEQTREALRRYDRLQRAKVHSEEADPAGERQLREGVMRPDRWGKTSIPSLRDKCPDVFYGYMNFGDLIWGFGYTSLFYDTIYGMLLQHIRTGDRTMFDLASDMASHRYDIDRGFWGWQHYEKGHHGHRARIVRKRYRSGFKPHASHTWCRGLFLYWVLTGDPRAYEAAELNATAYSKILDRQKDKPVVPMREFRVPAWGIEACLAMYEYKGDRHYLEKANDIFTRTLLGMEKENGSKGHIIKDGKQSAQFTSYAIEPVVRLINVTGRKDAADFLKRVLAWQRKNGVLGGTMKRDKYQPLMMKRHSGILADIDEEIQEASASLAYNLLFADGYAYLFGLFRTEKDMEFARDLYRDAMFYYGIPGTRVDPSARTPLGYHFRGRVDNMCAKVQAFMSRYGQVYMVVEDKLARPAETP